MGNKIATLLPDNYLYISHLDEKLKFWRLPCTPETISDSMASTFNETSALGRSAPVFTYSKSGPRSVQVGLNIYFITISLLLLE